ncbi:GNAT family N-acetyltransferase [Halolamina sp. CBA1230]|uniref:GNAT family N-acetyltransferase n=1 Tax=Halolamina sp. CBA1230 TaxID=1853690 RepID=UPI001301E201|nr:GNAT family N-acetyltransferase [Halolamina sp. CBA1230]QKY19284.1 GNAT family N-acetyltransferase [Halolamina sp. CBA1230]
MSLPIRRFRPADRDAVDETIEAALRSADAYFEDVPELEDDDILAEYVDAGGEFLVGEREGEIVATGAFRPPKGIVTEFVDAEGAAELKRMHVHPDHHREGIGQAMYDELEARARERGFARFTLATTGRQEPAHAFYESNGFERVGSTSENVAGTNLAILIFEKTLN